MGEKRDGKMSLPKGKIAIVGLVVALFGTAIVMVREEGLKEQEQQRTEEKQKRDAWPFEKYFEDCGNGVFHVDEDKLVQMKNPFAEVPEPDDPEKIRTTEELAALIGQWRVYHPERRIVSIVRVVTSIIIVTEQR